MAAFHQIFCWASVASMRCSQYPRQVQRFLRCAGHTREDGRATPATCSSSLERIEGRGEDIAGTSTSTHQNQKPPDFARSDGVKCAAHVVEGCSWRSSSLTLAWKSGSARGNHFLNWVWLKIQDLGLRRSSSLLPCAMVPQAKSNGNNIV